MKRLSLIPFLLLLASCTRFLNVQPQGYVLPKTDEEFAAILHNHLRDIEGGGDEYIVGNMETIERLEAFADDLDANLNVGSIPAYAGDRIGPMQSLWRDTWSVVRDCNIVIGNLDGRSSDLARSALSCAYSIKALCYLNLLKDFCQPWEDGAAADLPGLPVVDEFDIAARPARASLADTKTYITGLFDKALALHPSDPLFLFTEWPVKAYKARLLFWTEDWDALVPLCEDILKNSGFSISTRADFPAVIGAQNDRLGEVLLRSHINNSSELDWYFSAVRGYITTRPASASLIGLFDKEKDVRYACSFSDRWTNVKPPERRIRLSEVVLMLAEAYVHSGSPEKAYPLLNDLRAERIEGVTPLSEANLPPVRSDDRIKVDATGKPMTPLLQAILDERRRELYMEGDRWYELKRNGTPEWWIINNGLKYTTRAYLYTAPILKSDVDLNPDLKQNPGYVY